MDFSQPPKHAASAIIARLTKGPTPPSEEEGGDEVNSDHAQDAAIDDAFHAIKSGDIEGFRSALKAAIRLCGDEAEEGSEAPEQEG